MRVAADMFQMADVPGSQGRDAEALLHKGGGEGGGEAVGGRVVVGGSYPIPGGGEARGHHMPLGPGAIPLITHTHLLTA